MTPADRFAVDLGNLLSRHDLTGREFVMVCLWVAESYYPAADLPILPGVAGLLEDLK